MFYKIIKFSKTIIAFHKNLYAVIARSEATKQSQHIPLDCFANARNDYFLMKCYTRALPILLIILLMLFAGCASSKAVKQEAGESLNLITEISLTENSESLAISIKGKQLLTYTSVKQPMPLRVALYFPETALGEIETALTSDSDIVASIKASELTEDGHTSRIEIALRQDAPYEVFREGNGLQISFAKGSKITAQDTPDSKPAEISIPATTTPEEDKDKKPAWVNRVDFSSEEAGKSTIIIGTTRPVKYKMDKAADKRLQLTLFNTNLPDYRKRPLITTRFNSAVDRITPIQTSALKTSSMIVIELRELVPYYIEQTNDLLLVNFDASSILPKPLEQADLPSWKKVMAQTVVEAKEIEDKKAEDKVLRPKVARKYTGAKIALDFYDTDIKNVFRILMEISGKNFAIDKDVTGKVTLTLAKPVPWDQAFDLILKMNQLGQTFEGDIIRIATLETLKKEEAFRQAEISALLKAREQQKVLEPLVTKYIAVNYSKAKEDMLPHVEKILTTDRGSATVDERTNMIIITDIAEKIRQAGEIVKNLDKVTPQVIIEARIVEASTNFSREIGTEWGVTGGIQEGDANAGTGPQRGYDTLGGTYGYDMAMNFPIAAVNPATIGFNFLRIAGTPFLLNAKLMAMESEGEGKIISAPKVVTLDNKTAIIQRGEKIPYPVRNEDGTIGIEFAEATLKLEVTPHITDDKRINLIIDVQKDEPDWSKKVQDVPAIRTKNAHTELLINDGDTVVIGGIITTTKQFGEKGIPWLSKIPILGWLFKSQSKLDDKEELLIFITPQIVQLEQSDLIDG